MSFNPSTPCLRIGLLVERRRAQTRWERWTWRTVGVVPGAPGRPDWTVLRAADEAVLFHAASLELKLHADELADYLENIRSEEPSIYIVAHRLERGAECPPLQPVRLTVSPGEAQAYAEGADTIVDAIAMPAAVAQWIRSFVSDWHRGADRAKTSHRRAKPTRVTKDDSGPLVVPPVYRVPRP